jgi:esterase/lipase superfamily enzyme
MSGPYEVTRWTDGYVDDNVYFNSPCDFIPHEHEPVRLDALRRLSVILAIGRDDHARGDNERLAEILRSKGIPHALRIWDGSAHDWPWWQQMMQLYVNGPD